MGGQEEFSFTSLPGFPVPISRLPALCLVQSPLAAAHPSWSLGSVVAWVAVSGGAGRCRGWWRSSRILRGRGRFLDFQDIVFLSFPAIFRPPALIELSGVPLRQFSANLCPKPPCRIGLRIMKTVRRDFDTGLIAAILTSIHPRRMRYSRTLKSGDATDWSLARPSGPRSVGSPRREKENTHDL